MRKRMTVFTMVWVGMTRMWFFSWSSLLASWTTRRPRVGVSGLPPPRPSSPSLHPGLVVEVGVSVERAPPPRLLTSPSRINRYRLLGSSCRFPTHGTYMVSPESW